MPASGFDYVARGGEVVITHHGRRAGVLRGERARAFLAEVEREDPQELMARLTESFGRFVLAVPEPRRPCFDWF